MNKPVRTEGRSPCGHAAYVMDAQRGCLAVLAFEPDPERPGLHRYVLCGKDS